MSDKPTRTILELTPYGYDNEEDKFSKLGEAKDIVNAHLSYWGYKPIEAKYCGNGTFEFRYSSGIPNDLLNHIQGIIKENGVIMSVIRYEDYGIYYLNKGDCFHG